MTNILFVCRANRFRSKIAEAYMKKINHDKNVHIKSAGMIPGDKPTRPEVKNLLKKEFNIKIKGNPRGISTKLLIWANILVIVADDVPSVIFEKSRFKGKLIHWNIQDTDHKHPNLIRKIAKDIIKHVDKLKREI